MRSDYCRCCGHGLCPFDDRAGISARDLTPAAEQLATLAGAVADSFGKGADLLQEMATLRLSESTIQRATEGAGARLAALLAEGATRRSARPSAGTGAAMPRAVPSPT